MARRPRRPSPPAKTQAPSANASKPEQAEAPKAESAAPWLDKRRTWVAVVALLAIHYALAASSLVRENATVDETAHMPAGVSYWQKRTFRLYHHNPPLVKLVAALPVVLARPVTDPIYQQPCWTLNPPDHATFADYFARFNAAHYFDLFNRARLTMPLFSVVGGLVVFLWSRSLFGASGGLLSLALWILCPNVLAHARLVTSDVGATAIGLAATFLFWRFLQQPTWQRATWAGLVLGLAELTKFNMVLLYVVWPAIWLVRVLLMRAQKPLRSGWLVREAGQGVVMVALSVLVIDAGYFFEDVGMPLGKFEFASRTLTRPVAPGALRPTSLNPLLTAAWAHRVNWFRGTWLESLPAPLPKEYLLGFDEQKLESEGVPKAWFPQAQQQAAAAEGDDIGYPVYLDGVLNRTGWRWYYVWAALYKVPEGTWLLVLLSFVALAGWNRARASAVDEVALFAVPLVLILAMSLFTRINLGLRYVLPVFPFLFVSTGRLAPWAAGFLSRARQRAAGAVVGVSLAVTALATLLIHPHYLAYFNWLSGGPANGSRHLIDSNLDWGQDLVGLREWVAARPPDDQRIGLAYFGSVSPNLFAMRNDPLEWFLPPALPGKMAARVNPRMLVGPAHQLTPGLYAVSATLLRGLPWRLYDPHPGAPAQVWSADQGAFAYFRELEPVDHIGYSIFIYRVTPEDVARLARLWPAEVQGAGPR